VTGGAGFIGSRIAAALAARGERVRALDNLVTGSWSCLDGLPGAERIERVTGDVCDEGLVARACERIEVVFHEAALCSVPESLEAPLEYLRVIVGGTAAVLDAARRAGVRRVILASSAAVYGDDPELPKREPMLGAPLSPYALGKWQSEELLRFFARAYGLDTVSLRYFNVFGPGQLPSGPYAAAIPKFVDASLRGEPVTVFGDGEQTRDFCYVDNVVSANLLAAEAPARLEGAVLNVAGGASVSINALVRSLESAFGRALDVRHGPPRPGDVRHSLADVSRAREILGWVPAAPWQDGIAPTVRFLASRNPRA
jgi:UDP-glucose 4-epimerase